MKLNKLLTTTILAGCISTSAIAAPTSVRLKNLEERLDQLENKSMKISNVLKSHKVFGRIQYDKTLIVNDNDKSLQNSSRLRSGRIGVKGKLSHGWGYKFEVDFADTDHEVTDAYVKKHLSGNAVLKIGQFRQPFSLEKLTKATDTTFLERAAVTDIAPDRALGLGYAQHFDNVNVFAGIFDGDAGESASTDDESVSGAARVSLFEKDSDGNVFHLGFAGRVSEPTGDAIRYQVRPEAYTDSATEYAIDTGSIANANKIYQTGVEVAAVYDRASVQAEYINTDIDRDNNTADYRIEGGYVELSYFLTDDKRDYNSKYSVFNKVEPNSKNGAWQVAYRYSYLDADYNDSAAGDMENHTVGVNYYATKNIRLAANYVASNVSKDSAYGDDAELLALRAQVQF